MGKQEEDHPPPHANPRLAVGELEEVTVIAKEAMESSPDQPREAMTSSLDQSEVVKKAV